MNARAASASPGGVDHRLRNNNFDLLRFAFAFVVLLVHAHAFSAADPLAVFSKHLSSGLAVKGFFVVSGFLIFMSYENSRSTTGYFAKRIRRIYPAYAFVILASVLLGGFFSSLAWGDYLSMPVLKYLAANLVFLNFLQHDLPGVFENNPLHAVNGALWTLKIEVMFYCLVPLAVLAMRRLGRLQVLLAMYVGSVIYFYVMGALAAQSGSAFLLELQRQLPGQLSYFAAGAAAYYYFQRLAQHASLLALLALAAFLAKGALPWPAIEPLALATLVVYAACFVPQLGNFGKYGDFSYGVYILHSPILQVFVAYGLFAASPWFGLASGTALVLAASVLLWHFIEKPALGRSSHYVASSRS